MALSDAINSYTDFSYTGGMQSVTIPSDGIYYLQCWGPGGGVNGGTGGYADGYRIFSAGQVVYVCVGQAGGAAGEQGNRYNGGRDASTASNPAHWYGKHPGGGCTHMATATGELNSLYENKDAVLLVAGGGGAGATNGTYHGVGLGGDGGGTSNMDAQYTGAAYGTHENAGKGGNQYAFGIGEACNAVGTGSGLDTVSGGGAGWYGGRAGTRGGGGGGGYVGGVPLFTHLGITYAPYTSSGAGGGTIYDGWAKIKKVANLAIPVMFNGTQLHKILFNGTEVKSLVFNGTKLY